MPEHDLLDQLHTLMHAFKGELRRALHAAGHQLNGMEVRTLLWIAAHPGGTAGELAQHSGRDKAQLARVVQQLEQAGLVRRQADAADRRIQRLGLSEAGEALHAALRAERQAVAARMLGRLSGAEQKQLAALLARMAPD